MTLEQLRIFVAVAEREHVTRAAEALALTQSAASGAVAALEARHGVKLFHRVGRRIELTEAGRVFLEEARAVLARAAGAEQALADLAGLTRGSLRLVASQTIVAYWLPERLAAFRRRYPGVALAVAIANTEAAARAVQAGEAELGFVEGPVDDPALAQWPVGTDRLRLIAPDPVPAITNAWLVEACWVMRERGSGTRASFEAVLAARGVDPQALTVSLTLPSNEAVLAAVRAGAGCAALSELVVAPALTARMVTAAAMDMPVRPFFALRQKERYQSRAADALLETIRGYTAAADWVI
ncbi:LysR substrate-binding domain-containing protein [Sphingomonas morindae]|uniref:LysR family transcriptional regulator n=1 Tax=Sphingomonas morindae TaxID=1541170 RepID=A0ABY4X6Q9_9SPHN|nr:LysR substrate-binding domain-containing protein [Sphingomonas morindae]USI72566.1 LysR family transcriptional regulator [Sphingomonas morindae]